ncbi:dTDP-4-dehydrorhamnose reductase [uncultured Microbulbifer sp.]|uniref:dTDP-4-dehydrorhamnose reductase n=1 Tax=uncultured Microbulbifer sp. TaxID=348147 RepID=UPI00261E7058|nr:dTDP-4-dehydrorhamnose reductase [uncultured Microbulbifer sp.]
MKILLIGKDGQLGRELRKSVPQRAELIGLGRKELDICQRNSVMEVVSSELPDIVINAAAYTAVDKAESEPEQAFRVNAYGAENLALACKEFGARLIHVSTDFIFDGQKSSPYSATDPIRPLSVYGKSKAAGEIAVQEILPEVVIVRTSWIYAQVGYNFVNTMLRLMNERDRLSVVADQLGTPTSSSTLAETIYALVRKPKTKGIYHCTDAGIASWYDFAVAIYEESKMVGLLPVDKHVQIQPVKSLDYPAQATRPAYSVLDKHRVLSELGIELKHWRQALRQILQEKAAL